LLQKRAPDQEAIPFYLGDETCGIGLRRNEKKRNEETPMVAYEFYCHDEENGDNLIGVLPERRRCQERISEESIINWLRTVVGDTITTHLSMIYFTRVEI
jgi:hypothetical protein